MTNTEEAPCPDYVHPPAEPHYDSKPARDLSAFAAGMAALAAERTSGPAALLATATITDLQALLNTRHTTSAELVGYYVKQIARHDLNLLNSIMVLNPDAPSAAAELDEEWAAGRLRGPLRPASSSSPRPGSRRWPSRTGCITDRVYSRDYVK